jgi:choline dehydrogenase-like flavoprotein
MIIDLERTELPPLDPDYDVCISGAGIAGIVLAIHLADGGRRVLLLEGGGLEYSNESQDVYIGEVVGQEYFNLDSSRLRFLGGTSNHWGGQCRPLDSLDFLDRPAITGTKWPIDRSDLDPYLEPAIAILEIDEFEEDGILPGSSDKLKEITFRHSKVRFNDKYLDFLRASELITVLTNANVIDIQLDTERGDVSSFLFRSYLRENLYSTKARTYVLAMGGIENARVLLNTNRQRPNGLGNDHDLVGRYFMEHPHFDIGYFVFDSSGNLPERRRFWAPTPTLMRAEGIANCGLRLVPARGAKDEILATAKSSLRSIICSSDFATNLTREFKSSFSCRKKSRGKLPDLPFDNAGYLQVASEQVPNRNSRVLLAKKSDKFGRPRVALDWRLLPLDKNTIRTCGLVVGEYFAKQGLGRVKLHDWVLSDSTNFPGFGDGHEVAGHHHMGTTRMGTTASEGVVDGDCRVYGIGNLYVTGSSVFRTSGHANPTLTIVQLALRLGDTLLAEL